MSTTPDVPLDSPGKVGLEPGVKSPFTEAFNKASGVNPPATPAPPVIVDKQSITGDTTVPVKQPEPKPKVEPESKKEEPKAEKQPEATEPKPKVAKFDDVPAAIKSESAAENFKKIKARAEAAEARLAELEKTAKAPADYDEVKKQNEDLLNRIRLLDVTQDPRFQTYFSKKAQFVADTVKSTAGEEVSTKLLPLLNLPDSPQRREAINDAISELSPFDQAKIGAIVLEVDKLNSERQDAINNASQDYKRLEAERQARAENQKRENETVFESVIKSATDPNEGLEIFRQTDDPEASRAAKDALDAARQLFFGQDTSMDDLARAAVWAAAAPLYRNTVAIQAELIRKLEKQLGEQQQAKPTLGGVKAETKAAKKGFIESFNAAMKGE